MESQEKSEKEIDEELRFSFPPGSHMRPLQKYQAEQRKKPEYYPTNPSYRRVKQEPKISLSTDLFRERCDRHVYRAGGKRKPCVGIPEDWIAFMGLDIDNKSNAQDIVTQEFDPVRRSITIVKRPAAPEMSEAVDAELFTTDGDEYARAYEEEKEREEKGI
jgi:hypothetical protein